MICSRVPLSNRPCGGATLPRVTARFDSIRTERLLMRRWRESDRRPFAAMNADPQVMRYFPAALDRAASDAYMDRIEALFQHQGFGLWALEQASTGRFLGFTGLNPMPPGVPGAGGMEVGWRLAGHAWHQGFATEAATAALDVAFRGAGLAEVWSMTAVLNEPSQARDAPARHDAARAFRAPEGRGRPSTAPARGLPDRPASGRGGDRQRRRAGTGDGDGAGGRSATG